MFMFRLADQQKKDGKSDEEVAEWKKKMQGWVVALLKKDRFKKLEFYAGKPFFLFCTSCHGMKQFLSVRGRCSPRSGQIP